MVEPFSLKYRPKKLSEVIGQEVVVRILSNSFKNKNWHNTYILDGIIGTGKTSILRIMAAMDNCEKGPTLEPCGKCKNCQDIFLGRSEDVMEVDAASNRSIENIRDIQEKISFHPISSKVKYVCLDEAHALTGYAAEAALKMLEEPPPYVRFILATTELSAFKPALLSRGIILNLRKIEWHQLANHLCNIANIEKIEYDEEALKVIARISEGSVRNSLQKLQTVRDFSDNQKITVEMVRKVLGCIDEVVYYNLIQSIIDINVSESVVIMNKILSQGINAEKVVSDILRYLRQLMLCHFFDGDVSSIGISSEEHSRYKTQLPKATPVIISKMENLLIDVRRALMLNMDVQALMENFIINSSIIVAKNNIKSDNSK